MAKQKKTVLFTTITEPKSGISTQIFVDRDTKEFKAQVAGQWLINKDGELLEKQVLEAIQKSLELEWKPFITVNYLSHNYSGDGFIGLTIRRDIYAKLPDGTYREANWGAPEGAEITWARPLNWSGGGEFNPPCKRPGYSYSGDGSNFYLPYTQELWDGLEELRNKITALRKQLELMLLDPSGLAQIAALSNALLLPMGAVE